MSTKWITMSVLIFVILHIALIPLGNTAMDETARNALNNVAYFGIPSQSTSIGLVDYVKAPANYFQSLYYIGTSGYYGNPLFAGQMQMVGWLLLAPILAGWAFGLIVSFFQIFRYATS